MAAIDEGLKRGNLLIRCAAGYRRSPILAAAWMDSCGYLNFEAALREIAKLGPTCDPSPILLEGVKQQLNRLT